MLFFYTLKNDNILQDKIQLFLSGMKRSKRIILLVFSLLLIAAVILFYIWNRKIYYPNFGIRIPANYELHGIDVSRHQGWINWKQVAAMKDKDIRLKFCFIKATEGISHTDIFFKINWYRCKKNGIKRGAYLYFHPAKNGKLQAKQFIKTVSLEKGDFAPVIDFEETNDLSKAKIIQSLKLCITTLETKYGKKPIIYCNVDFYEQYVKDDFTDYPIWIAHYNRAFAPRINEQWSFWQHNCKGHVNGIASDVDFNVFSSNDSELSKLCL